jgi:Predicted metal-dependent membrane protease
MNVRKYDYYMPTLGHSWLIVLLLMAGSLVFGMILGFIGNISGWNVVNWTSFSYLLTMLLPFFYIWYQSGKCFNESELLGIEPVRVNEPLHGGARNILFFLVIAVAMFAISIVVEPTISVIPMSDRMQAIFEQVFNNPNTFDLVLSTCILAPLCEEMLCRGVIMRGILQQKKSPWKAIVWSAFIFAVIHMNPWQGIVAFVMGLFLGWVYYRTGNLWATIFLHFVNNSSSVILSKVFPDVGVNGTYADILPEGSYKLFYIGAVVILAAAVFVLDRMMPKITEK